MGALRRVVQLLGTQRGRKLVRYSSVSIISAAVSFVVLALVYGVLRLWTEVPSTLFSNVVAGVPAYFLSRQWVWGRSGRSHLWREVVPFWVLSITGIVFAIGAAVLARHVVQADHLHHLLGTVVVMGANVGAFGVLWLFKFLVLNRYVFGAPTPDVALAGDS